MPGVKALVKSAYIRANAIIHKKRKPFYIHSSLITGIELITPDCAAHESFFGYYDKRPDNGRGLLIYNETEAPTSREPDPAHPLTVNILDLDTRSTVCSARSETYNWQQGCRAQWIDNDRVIFNVLRNGAYRAAILSVRDGKITDEFPLPVQDAWKDRYYLAIDYRRIQRMTPDYGYRNLPPLSDADMADMEHDGIRRVDIATGQDELILSLRRIADIEPDPLSAQSMHQANHVMISPDGSRFIFIHRRYHKGRRFDRLMMCGGDGSDLRVVSDGSMVSHLCWIDDSTLFGYLRHEGRDGFWFIDLDGNRFTPCEALNSLGSGDGHPSVYGDWIVVDSYPDKSRMQHLYLYNIRTRQVTHLLEVFQSVRYAGQTRCDLHPRFSCHGDYIYFDTVYAGRRILARVNVADITVNTHP